MTASPEAAVLPPAGRAPQSRLRFLRAHKLLSLIFISWGIAIAVWALMVIAAVAKGNPTSCSGGWNLCWSALELAHFYGILLAFLALVLSVGASLFVGVLALARRVSAKRRTGSALESLTPDSAHQR